jgi:hypothetical protein
VKFPTDCPIAPVVDIGLELNVNEPVNEGGRHPEGYGAVLLAVSRRDNPPPWRQDVFTDSAIQHQLVEARLDEWRSSVDLVKEQDAWF